MRSFTLLILLVVAGCRSAPVHPAADCTPPSTPAAPPESAAVAAISPGRFALVKVNTVRAYGGEIVRGTLNLGRPRGDGDVVERPTIHGPRNFWRPLAGHYETTANGLTYRATAEVWAGAMTVGCVDCMDGSPTIFTIVAVMPDGFVGRWVNNESGIAVPVDRRGRRLPNPGGFYCVHRIGS